MACGSGENADDCAVLHWCDPLRATREKSAWRADCPVCHSSRALEFDVPKGAKSVRWKSHCAKHGNDAVRPKLAELVLCWAGRVRRLRRPPVDRQALITLALAEMPPQSKALALLELAGLSTREALDKMGVRRENRSRVIAGRASDWMQKRR